jgi:hypothetical protein
VDGKNLGFTFDTKSFIRVRKQFRDLERSKRGEIPRPGRFLRTAEVFSVIHPEHIEDDTTTVEVPKYSDISFWNGYIDYMSDPFVERPKFKMLKTGKKTFALPPIL